MESNYKTYADLKAKYNRSEKTIWKWWAKDGTLEPPKRAGRVLLGWTEEQLIKFENGEG